MKLIKLGFTKLAKEEKSVPKQTPNLLTLPKVEPLPKQTPNNYIGKNIVRENLDMYSNTITPKPIHPITKKVLTGISKDFREYAAGNTKV